jgi:hypothetical protein
LWSNPSLRVNLVHTVVAAIRSPQHGSSPMRVTQS